MAGKRCVCVMKRSNFGISNMTKMMKQRELIKIDYYLGSGRNSISDAPIHTHTHTPVRMQ